MSNAETVAASRDKPAEEDRGRSLFIYKAVATTLGGSLLTLCVAMAQISYANHLEVLRRQGEQGQAFQARLLELTGRIDNELNHILNLVRHSATPDQSTRVALLDDAEDRMEQNLTPLYQQWELERLLLRNRGAQIYGSRVGNLIYSLAEGRFQENDCSVVGRVVDPPPNDDCARMVAMERDFLRGFVAGIRQSGTMVLYHRNERSPRSFDANASIARTVLHRYIACAMAEGRPDLPPRCQHMPEAREIAVRRVELVGIAREGLAEAIIERSALQD